ncbi:hypothetical protein FA95DRAFT_1564714 [Auriscalpium vulgare]|uniref:Uncharacterized protein n=1 Tax=Auriscalpium vulgare TaxID=40419 RepID=A0ACB8RDU0_9AGAM|nr:hypothetical protein FA95DRAFT_1564714 [Auriscalpium vulgare]
MAAVNDPLSKRQPRDLSLPVSRTSILSPEVGAFVVFTLDPVASLDALEDPIALDAACVLASFCKKYLGYLTVVLIDEHMSTPVAPATHPQGRRAVAPIPALPLPRDDLFIHYNF